MPKSKTKISKRSKELKKLKAVRAKGFREGLAQAEVIYRHRLRDAEIEASEKLTKAIRVMVERCGRAGVSILNDFEIKLDQEDYEPPVATEETSE